MVRALIVNRSTVLLLKRKNDDFMPGIYELPSGKVESNETLEQALVREVQEETALFVKSIDGYLGHFDYTSGNGKKTRQFNFAVTVEPPLNICLTEHETFEWCPMNSLDQYPISPSVKTIVKSFK